MIRLLEIVKEITFTRGQAGSDKIEDISDQAIYETDIYEYLDRPEEYDELELPITDSKFQKALRSKLDVIATSGNYNLIATKKISSDDVRYYYLVDTKAKKIGEFFVGTIRTEINAGEFYNLKKGFDIQIETVHWSNIGIELRGSGLGKTMYTLLYNHVIESGRAFGSDSMLYEGSAGMWMTYVPTIASYFGVIINDIIIPIQKEELNKKNKHIFGMYGVRGFVAMENPPKQIRKIAYNTQGLSFVGGEYGVVTLYVKVNDKIDVASNDKSYQNLKFIDLVNACDSLKQLMNLIRLEISDSVISKKTKYKTIIFSFDNAIIVVKQTESGLVSVVM